MVQSNKILTVSYGTFSCTLEGFDDAFGTMKAIAEYFRDLAAEDRYFGAEPPQPDADMLAHIAQQEIARRVEARQEEGGIVLRAQDAAAAVVAAPVVADAAPEAPTVEDTVAAHAAEIAEEAATPVVEDVSDLIAAEIAEPAGDANILEELSADQDEGEVFVEETAAAFFAGSQDDTATEEEDEVEAVAEAAPAPASSSDSIAAKLQRIRAVVSKGNADGAKQDFSEDEHADLIDTPSETVDAKAKIAEMLNADAVPVETAEDQDALIDDLNERLETLDPADAVEDMAEMTDEDHDDAVVEIAEDDAADDTVAEAEDDAEEDIVAEAEDDAEEDTVAEAEDDAEDDTVAEAEDEAEDDTVAEAEDDAEEDTVAEAEDDAEDDTVAEAEDDAEDDTVAEAEDDAEEDTVAEAEDGAEDNTVAEAEDEADDMADAAVAKVSKEEFDAILASDRGEDLPSDDHAVIAEDTDEVIASSLSAEDEEDLMRELAAVEAEMSSEDAEADSEDTNEAEEDEVDSIFAEAEVDADADADEDFEEERAILSDDVDSEDDVSRLLEEADDKLSDSETSDRRSEFAHLRAAMAAGKAEEAAGGSMSEAASEGAYREDLARVVKPRRPESAEPGELSARPQDEKPAPLKLVAAQRIDAEFEPVQPRRVMSSQMDDMGEDGADGQMKFADYADGVGAYELPDLLEAAAAYLSFVEGQEQFSRPQLMTKVRMVENQEFSREDGLRSFGLLLRDGKIEKTQAGRFTVSDRIGFRPEDMRAAG